MDEHTACYQEIAQQVANIIWSQPESEGALRAQMVIRAALNQLAIFAGHEFNGRGMAQDVLQSFLESP